MINKDRIVPIQVIDLISMYGLILQQNNATLAAVAADNVEGDFNITAAATPLILNEPVQSVNIASGVSAATIYFVAGYNYAGFTLNNVAVVPTEPQEGVLNDAKTLYKAVLASNAVTITKVGF